MKKWTKFQTAVFLISLVFCGVAFAETTAHYEGIVLVWKALGWAAIVLGVLAVFWKHGYPWTDEDKDCKRQLSEIRTKRLEDAKKLGALDQKLRDTNGKLSGLQMLLDKVRSGEV